MKIIAFLGNPGKKYARNRHNIGFIIGEYFARQHGISCGQKKFNALSGNGKIDGEDICLLFPQAYMNKSGESVIPALNYYGLDVQDLVAVHDEIEFNFGRVEIKFGGGHKGHNGIRSIVQCAASADFHRLRFGVGRPENPEIPIADYVLGNFLPEEMVKIEELLPRIDEMLMDVIKKRD